MALSFNGSSGYVASDTVPVTAAPLTMACFYYWDATGSPAKYLISLGNAQIWGVDFDSFHLWINTNSTNEVCARAKDTSTTGNAASANASTGVWEHACGVFTSTTSRAAFKNGTNKGTDTTTVAPDTPTNFDFGALRQNTVTNHFNGDMAEVGVWNAALTDAEVASLAKGRSPLLIRPQSLVFYCPVVGTRTTEIDLTSKATLTLNGSPAKAAHPQVFKPSSQIIQFPGTAAGAAPSPTSTIFGPLYGPLGGVI